jgi:hypothetical protein
MDNEFGASITEVPVEFKEGITTGDAEGIRLSSLKDSFFSGLDRVRELGNKLQIYRSHDEVTSTLIELNSLTASLLEIDLELNK